MLRFFIAQALLGEKWQHNVTLEVNDRGVIAAIIPDSEPGDATQLTGAMIPAMTNLHSHAFQRAMAGLTEVAGDPQDSFWTWREQMYRLVGRLTPEQVGVIARHLYCDLLRGGYTQVAEFHYLHHDFSGLPYAQDEMLQQLLAAAVDSGIGQTLLPVLYSYAGFGAQPPQPAQRRFIQSSDQYLAQQDRLAHLITPYPLINRGLCFHSLRAVSESQISQVLSASAADLPVHIHVAEQQKEVDDCLAWSRQRPVEWLLDHVDVDARWCLIHATHMTPPEIERLARSQAVAGLCPTTEANLGDGIFPATAYLAAQGRWGIGSDSHVSLSALEELRWLEYAQRLRDCRRNRLTSSATPGVGNLLWQQAAQGGAQACGLALGKLAVGYRADWLLLDDAAWFSGCTDEQRLNCWLFAGDNRQIRDVFVAGKQVIHQGRHRNDEQNARQLRTVMQALYS